MIDAPNASTAPALSQDEQGSPDADLHRLPIPPDPLTVHYQLWMLYVTACSVGCILGSCLLWNATASLPLGLYWRLREPTTRRGDLVSFPVPEGVRALVSERGYLPAGSLLVKPIAASAGDRVCSRDGTLIINDEVFGNVLTTDREGRALPMDKTCGVLPPGQIYVASRTPGSFDSRTFGPVEVSDLQARVVPLWTF